MSHLETSGKQDCPVVAPSGDQHFTAHAAATGTELRLHEGITQTVILGAVFPKSFGLSFSTLLRSMA